MHKRVAHIVAGTSVQCPKCNSTEVFMKVMGKATHKVSIKDYSCKQCQIVFTVTDRWQERGILRTYTF